MRALKIGLQENTHPGEGSPTQAPTILLFSIWIESLDLGSWHYPSIGQDYFVRAGPTNREIVQRDFRIVHARTEMAMVSVTNLDIFHPTTARI